MSIYLTPTTIKDARRKLGMTQGEFAKEIGIVTAKAVSNWETGTNIPGNDCKPKLRELIAKANGVEVEQVEKSTPKTVDDKLAIMNETTMRIRELEAEIIKLKAAAYDRITGEEV